MSHDDILKTKDLVNYHGYDRQASVYLRRQLNKYCDDYLKDKEIQAYHLEQYFR